jgi:hypothetical protein
MGRDLGARAGLGFGWRRGVVSDEAAAAVAMDWRVGDGRGASSRGRFGQRALVAPSYPRPERGSLSLGKCSHCEHERGRRRDCAGWSYIEAWNSLLWEI